MTVTETATSTTCEVAPAELARLLANALVAAGKDRTRPVLCAVNVTIADGSLIAEATDSYILLRQEISVTHEGHGTFLVPREAAEAIVKMLKGYKCGPDHRVTIDFSEREVTVRTVDQSGTWRWRTMSDYDYPRTASLWPTTDPDPTATVSFGADNLARLAKLVGSGGKSKCGETITFDFFGELKAVRFSLGAGVTGLVMPVRRPI